MVGPADLGACPYDTDGPLGAQRSDLEVLVPHSASVWRTPSSLLHITLPASERSSSEGFRVMRGKALLGPGRMAVLRLLHLGRWLQGWGGTTLGYHTALDSVQSLCRASTLKAQFLCSCSSPWRSRQEGGCLGVGIRLPEGLKCMDEAGVRCAEFH